MKQLRITTQITNRDSVSLDKYLNDIGKEAMITADEEVELALRIQKGDEKALEQLTRANLRFVVSVAKQYQGQGIPLSDLINEGNIGLIKAAERFDPSKGFKFISYAVWWIRQSIMQSIIDQSRLVRLPLNKASAYHKIYKVSLVFEQEHERKPNLQELSELTDLKPSIIRDIMNNGTRHSSLDAPITEGEETSLSDMLYDGESDDPDEVLMQESLQKELSSMFATLTAREVAVLKCYFGLNGESRHTLAEIGEKYDLTRERVRQIKERALRRLRKVSQTTALVTYLD